MSWLPKKCVVVPIDFSDDSLAALEEASALVIDASALHVVHVLAVLHAGEPGVVWGVIDDEEREASVREALAKRLTGDLTRCNIHVRIGSPGPEIARVAKEVGAELVVMPTHGRTGLARLGMGSVAEQVVRLSPCAVLVLRRDL